MCLSLRGQERGPWLVAQPTSSDSFPTGLSGPPAKGVRVGLWHTG